MGYVEIHCTIMRNEQIAESERERGKYCDVVSQITGSAIYIYQRNDRPRIFNPILKRKRIRTEDKAISIFAYTAEEESGKRNRDEICRNLKIVLHQHIISRVGAK